MAVSSIDATSGGASSNSFATIAEITTYNDEHPDNTKWSGATTDVQKIAAITATRLLDEWVQWVGTKATAAQALRWPRYGVLDVDEYYIDGDVIPNFLKDATSELARIIAEEGNITKDPDTQGFKSLQAGSLKMEIDKADRDKIGVLPDSVLAIVEPYGTVRKRGGTGTVKLLRT